MKVVMLRPSYLPEQSGGNHLAVDLVEEFIDYGFEVEVITPVSEDFNEDEIPTLDYPVYRVKSNVVGNSTISRMQKYLDTSLQMYRKLMDIDNIDIIMSHSMPPTLGPLSVLAGKIKKVPVLYWEQDIVSQSIKSTDIVDNKLLSTVLYNLALLVEKISLKGSTQIITISNKFKDLRIDQKINPKKIEVIYNWIDTEQIKPMARNSNFLFEKYNLDKEKFYVTYCGNLGIPQNVEIMVDAAEKLQEHQEINFLIFGGGSREEAIKNYIQEKKLPNVKLFPLEPLKNASEVYNVGDIGLVIAKSGTSNNGFPSKTWSILAAGKPIISCFDLDSELSSLIDKNNLGLSIAPDSSQKLAEAVLSIYSSREAAKLMGENSRKIVENKYSRDVAAKRFIKIIENLVENRNTILIKDENKEEKNVNF